jgi:hypothetical protein
VVLRWIVRIAIIVLIGLVAFFLLAPLAPDGSGISDARQAFADGLRAWWGNPIAP